MPFVLNALCLECLSSWNAVRLGGPRVPLAPNAGPQPRLEAAATQERRLEGVGCRPMLGEVFACRGRSLAPGQLSHYNRVWAREALTPLDK